MTVSSAARPAAPRQIGWVVMRVAGWALITAGSVIALYLVYSLFFTNVETRAAQQDLLERWERDVSVPGAAVPQQQGDPQSTPPPAPAGDAVALLEFLRPGAADPPVHRGPLAVVEGVSLADLARGPGQYPGTAAPGAVGNFAVAGHRTTHGAPFFHLDQLTAGDEVHVVDRAGDRHVYRVVALQVVAPDAVWVVSDDPLGTGRAMLTLTTCHPRFSARQRLVAFAELASS